MELQEYINTTFPGLVLKPSLYYQGNIGLHFDLAKDLYQLKTGTNELNPDYFNQVYTQAISLFKDLFTAEDQIFLVTNIYQNKDFVRKSKKKMKVYHHYLKDKDVRFRLKQEVLPYVFDDEKDFEENNTSRFSLQCCKQDIRYQLLIKAICNQDFPTLKPRLHNPYHLYNPDVFFINITNNIIFYIYDDRGCVIIASDIETIRPIYEKYTDLVDEYCHEEIYKRFK